MLNDYPNAENSAVMRLILITQWLAPWLFLGLLDNCSVTRVVIVAHRMVDEIQDVAEKVHVRDLFGSN